METFSVVIIHGADLPHLAKVLRQVRRNPTQGCWHCKTEGSKSTSDHVAVKLTMGETKTQMRNKMVRAYQTQDNVNLAVTRMKLFVSM